MGGGNEVNDEGEESSHKSNSQEVQECREEREKVSFRNAGLSNENQEPGKGNFKDLNLRSSDIC
jgi:hypothetical protein